MTDTLSTLSVEAKTFYDRELLYRARVAQVYYNAGVKKNLKRQQGNQISWRRFERLTPITTSLSEGVTPTATALSLTEVTATVSHYGAYVEVSDQLDLMGIDPVISESTELLGQHGGESVEAIVVNIVKAGTSVIYATGSSRGAVGSSNVLTVALIRKAVRTLDANNTMRIGGPMQNDRVGVGTYVAFVHPNAVYDLQNDTEWKNMQEYSQPEKLFNGEIGYIMGTRIVQTTLAPIFSGAGSGNADVYGTVVVGQNAFGVVDVGGTGKFQTIVEPVGSAGAADPLHQRGTIGWKSTFVSKILNNNFMTRIEHGVTA